jgi:hypothetical protein
MTTCSRSPHYFKNRKQRRERVLRKMANMRAAKERKRLADPTEREPALVRYFPMEVGVRDKRTGETAWVDFRSVRDAARRLSMVQRFYR